MQVTSIFNTATDIMVAMFGCQLPFCGLGQGLKTFSHTINNSRTFASKWLVCVVYILMTFLVVKYSYLHTPYMPTFHPCDSL